jgi:hypothetical protein
LTFRKDLKGFSDVVESADSVKDSLEALSGMGDRDEAATAAAIDNAADAIADLQERLEDLLEPDE